MTVDKNGPAMVHAGRAWGGPVSNFRAILVGAAILLAFAMIVVLYYRS
jgi:hypothetical protein